jgi:DNA-binding transcriptional LysR family regulator
MRGELGDYAKGLRGNVRVLANTVAIAELLPHALASFLSAHPNIDVELEDRPSREIVRSIAEGRGDIGIVYLKVPFVSFPRLPAHELTRRTSSE